jgi:hypothetical protein
MQSLAILWFQLQMAKQSLREEYFAPAQVPAKTESTTSGTPRRANRKVYSHFVKTAACIALAAVGLQVKFSLFANILPAAQATSKTSVSFVQPEKAGAVDTVADTTVSVVHPEKSGATTLQLTCRNDFRHLNRRYRSFGRLNSGCSAMLGLIASLVPNYSFLRFETCLFTELV